MSDLERPKDVLGVGPIAEALVPVTRGLVDGAAAFLSRVCLPAAEEFGFLLRDRVSAWRARNAARIAAKAEAFLGDDQTLQAPPRLVAQVIEQGSWAEDTDLQTMWAGLLASACTERGDDDSNLIFTDIVSRLTASEARLLAHACKHSEKRVSESGWLHAYGFALSIDRSQEIAGIADRHRLYRELEHLLHLGLLAGRIDPTLAEVDLTPSGLALQMFARCEGCRSDPAAFLGAYASPRVDFGRAGTPLGGYDGRDSKGGSGQLRVLVLDDEPSIRKALGMTLEANGFEPVLADSADAALVLAREGSVELALIDLRMPDTRGDVLFELLANRHPGLRNRSIIMSGDITGRAAALVAATGCPFLRKPFSVEELLMLLEQRARA